MLQVRLSHVDLCGFPHLSRATLLQVMNEDGYSSTIKDKILTIDVKPGWRQGTRITFEKEGDQVRGREAE